jgi:hypothetical protein
MTMERSKLSDGIGILVDFDSKKWLYIPMALPEGYSSPKKWAWEKSVEISEDKGLDQEAAMSICRYLERLAESSNEFEHRFVLLEEIGEHIMNVTIMFDMNEDGSIELSSLLPNEEGDESMVPFFSENLGTGLKAFRNITKKRIFRDDYSLWQYRYAFVKGELAITVHASYEDREFLVRHEEDIDYLIKSVIAVA